MAFRIWWVGLNKFQELSGSSIHLPLPQLKPLSPHHTQALLVMGLSLASELKEKVYPIFKNIFPSDNIDFSNKY